MKEISSKAKISLNVDYYVWFKPQEKSKCLHMPHNQLFYGASVYVPVIQCSCENKAVFTAIGSK